jgi:hypothetical protein
MLEASSEWETLREFLEARLSRTEGGAAAQLHERLARLCGDRLRDRAAELFHWEQIAAREPRRADVWHRHAESYEQEDRPRDAARDDPARLDRASASDPAGGRRTAPTRRRRGARRAPLRAAPRPESAHLSGPAS